MIFYSTNRKLIHTRRIQSLLLWYPHLACFSCPSTLPHHGARAVPKMRSLLQRTALTTFLSCYVFLSSSRCSAPPVAQRLDSGGVQNYSQCVLFKALVGAATSTTVVLMLVGSAAGERWIVPVGQDWRPAFFSSTTWAWDAGWRWPALLRTSRQECVAPKESLETE